MSNTTLLILSIRGVPPLPFMDKSFGKKEVTDLGSTSDEIYHVIWHLELLGEGQLGYSIFLYLDILGEGALKKPPCIKFPSSTIPSAPLFHIPLLRSKDDWKNKMVANKRAARLS